MLRRTGEEKEEDSGDCISAVAGFGTGCVVGGRRRIAEGDRGFWLGRSFVYLVPAAPLRYGWAGFYFFFHSFLFFFF
jgi:hypothetical protein